MVQKFLKNIYKPLFKDIIYNCSDFLKRRDGKFEYIMAIKDNVTETDTALYEITEFEGGLYALAMSIDGDDESILRHQKIFN